MEETSTIQDSTPKESGAISLELAKIRVTRWLNAITNLPSYNGNPLTIPRAIMISFDDINDIIAKYPEKDLKGIRLYFGLAGEDNPGPANITDLRGMAVPVFYADKYKHHADLIITGLPSNPNDTSIYDFTTPCPAYCDVQSELYVPVSGS
ncbi:MAG TPA: hypothetical protein VHB54_10025 [Mucilaginibacter sp.]|nr:hypothetical protein [Mucilaginibacter sp.]